MAYSLGQYTYKEKEEEQSWLAGHSQSGKMFIQSVVEHHEELCTDLCVLIVGIRSLCGTSKNRELRKWATPVIPVLEASC